MTRELEIEGCGPVDVLGDRAPDDDIRRRGVE